MSSPRPIAIVVSRYNASVTDRLLDGAIEAAAAAGLSAAVVDAPGAFELPAIAARCTDSGAYAGVACLGCVIRGETRHDRHISSAIAAEIARLSVDSGVPVTFGVITAENAEQAHDRAGGAKGNKGQEAVEALIGTLRALDAIDAAVEAGTPERVRPVPGGTASDKAITSAAGSAGTGTGA